MLTETGLNLCVFCVYLNLYGFVYTFVWVPVCFTPSFLQASVRTTPLPRLLAAAPVSSSLGRGQPAASWMGRQRESTINRKPSSAACLRPTVKGKAAVACWPRSALQAAAYRSTAGLSGPVTHHTLKAKGPASVRWLYCRESLVSDWKISWHIINKWKIMPTVQSYWFSLSLDHLYFE